VTGSQASLPPAAFPTSPWSTSRSSSSPPPAERWRLSRVDVSEGTKIQQRTSVNRAVAAIGSRHIDTLTPQDVAAMVGELHGEGLKPSFIRKIVQATAMVFDHANVTPNPARDKTIVKLPREEPET
jgi:hypothetical protein